MVSKIVSRPEGKFRIVASLGHPASLVKHAAQAGKMGADLIEVRVDAFGYRGHEDLESLLSQVKKVASLPLIGTIRSGREQEPGSRALKLSDRKRMALYERLIPWVDIIDVELHSEKINRRIIKLAHQSRKKVILSYHDFESMPTAQKIERLVRKFKGLSGDIFKIAGTPKKKSEVNLLMARCLTYSKINRIFIAMGSLGKDSRMKGGSYGSCMTYGYLGKRTAPGQISVRTLSQRLKRRK